MCLGNTEWRSKTLDWNDNCTLKHNCEYVYTDNYDGIGDIKLVNGLNVLHLNIRSLKSKKEELIEILNNIENYNITIHLILLCETYIMNYNVNYCQLPGYSLSYKIRTDSRGGGVAIFTHNSISCDAVDLTNWYQSNIFECISVQTKLNGKSIIVMEIYHPPNSDHDLFIRKFNEFLSECACKYDISIIGGDFNHDLLKLGNKKSDVFFDILLDYKRKPTVIFPTRVTHNTSTLIDNIFVYTKADLFNVEELHTRILVDISDHFPCMSTIPGVLNTVNDSVCIESRKFSQDKLLLVNHDLLHADWSVLHNKNVNDAYNMFSDFLRDSLDKHIPFRKTWHNPTRQSLPYWYSKRILRNRSKCKKLFKESCLDPQLVSKYKSYRNSLNRLILHEKHEFYRERFQKFRGNIRTTWSLINSLTKKSTNKNDTINAIKDGNGMLITDPTSICNKFVDKFSNLAKQLAPTITHVHHGDPNLEASKLALQSINEHDVERIIKDLKSKTSCGWDGITNTVVKSLVTGVRLPLTIICNLSISQKVFPDAMKIAKIRPLHKGGSRVDIDNYRPISLLPVFSKILQCVVHRQIQRHMNIHNLYYKNQYGFRKKSSTINACQKFLVDVLMGLDTGNLVASVFIDLKKSF